MNQDWIDIGYLLAAVSFILALKLLKSPHTARTGNLLAAAGMAVALIMTLFTDGIMPSNFVWIGSAVAAGTLLAYVPARRVPMTGMPQMVALLNGLGGGAVALVALIEFIEFSGTGADWPIVQLVTTVLSAVIGCVSFSGSLVAYAKLQELMPSKAIVYPGQKALNLMLLAGLIALVVLLIAGKPLLALYVGLIAASLLVGVLIVIPIGGADMPVVISLLNSFTGTAAGLAGFALGNSALLIGGGLVGASGLILTIEMCRAMNRSLENVIFGALGAQSAAASGALEDRAIRNYTVEDAAIIFSNSDSVIIVPGYGMAVAQAQHVVKELVQKLQDRDIDVKFAIHPVAGRMPGHMNVLLAEADVPYESLYDLEEINSMFVETDVALVVGANDVVNPAARSDTNSPIYGMPILDVDKAKSCIVIKRSMNTGFAGIDNELFYQPNTIMVFGDAKGVIAKLSAALDDY